MFRWRAGECCERTHPGPRKEREKRGGKRRRKGGELLNSPDSMRARGGVAGEHAWDEETTADDDEGVDKKPASGRTRGQENVSERGEAQKKLHVGHKNGDLEIRRVADERRGLVGRRGRC